MVVTPGQEKREKEKYFSVPAQARPSKICFVWPVDFCF